MGMNSEVKGLKSFPEDEVERERQATAGDVTRGSAEGSGWHQVGVPLLAPPWKISAKAATFPRGVAERGSTLRD